MFEFLRQLFTSVYRAAGGRIRMTQKRTIGVVNPSLDMHMRSRHALGLINAIILPSNVRRPRVKPPQAGIVIGRV